MNPGPARFLQNRVFGEWDTQPVKGPARVPYFLHTQGKARGTANVRIHSPGKFCAPVNLGPARFLQKIEFLQSGRRWQPTRSTLRPGKCTAPASWVISLALQKQNKKRLPIFNHAFSVLKSVFGSTIFTLISCLNALFCKCMIHASSKPFY